MGIEKLDVRKHVSQMNKGEKSLLLSFIRGKYKTTKYSWTRMNQRRIDMNLVNQTIKEGNIVEYHQTKGNSRVLLRSSNMYKGKVACVVVDIVQKLIITVYFNWAEDRHYTLDKSMYMEDLDITKCLCSSLNIRR